MNRYCTLGSEERVVWPSGRTEPHAFGEDECTDKAIAGAEIQFPHAFGEDECTDITCEEKRKREMCEDGRRESTAAHG
jgi:hypothetical protein